MYGRPNQASVFRTYQGWLSMRSARDRSLHSNGIDHTVFSEIGQRQSTICFFPDVVLSNAYTILRPFFRPKSTPLSEDPLAAENWEYGTFSPSTYLGYR